MLQWFLQHAHEPGMSLVALKVSLDVPGGRAKDVLIVLQNMRIVRVV